MLTRRAAAERPLEDKLQLNLLKLKTAQAMIEQLPTGRNDSEKEIIEILEENKQLKSNMAELLVQLT